MIFFFHVTTLPAAPINKVPPKLTFQSAKQCQPCHQQIYDEWSESWMAKSYQNPVFQQDFLTWQRYAVTQGDDPKSCLRCHAPVAILTGDNQFKNVTNYEGVTCTVCHKVALVREREGVHYLVMDPREHVLYGSAARKPENKGSNGAHQIRPSQALSDSTLCAGCHLDVLANGTPLEYTYHEWKNSVFAASGMQCNDCHMPMVQDNNQISSHRSHRFQGGHSSSELLKGIASIKVLSLDPDGVLKINVSNLRAGHNFPTGGAHPAKLILKLEIKSDKGDLLHQDSKVYQFTFHNKQGAEVKGSEAVSSWKDTTLKPQEVRQEKFILPKIAPTATVHIALIYELIPALMVEKITHVDDQQYYKAVIIDTIDMPAVIKSKLGEK